MKRRRRYAVTVAASLALHATLFAIFVYPRAPVPAVTEPPVTYISLFDGPAAAAAAAPSSKTVPPAKPPPPPAPSLLPPQPVAPTAEVTRDPANDPVAQSVAAAAAGGETCQVSQWLQQALQTDPAVQSALAHMPRTSRSISNALMLWDRNWVRAEPAAGSEVSTIAQAIVSGLRETPDACRQALVRGPELMTLRSGDDTIVIAIGSGEWSWQTVLISP